MGKTANGWIDVIDVDWSGRITGSITAELLDKGGSETVIIGSNVTESNIKLPAVGRDYRIRYTAVKPECEGVTPSNEIYRAVNVTEYIDVDTVPPRIWWEGLTYEQSKNPPKIDVFKDEDAVAKIPNLLADDGRGNSLTGAIENIGPDPKNINTAVLGNTTLEYRVCKTTRNPGGSTGEKCDTTKRVVSVIEQQIIGQKPIPTIRLATYTMTISGNQYHTQDTVFVIGGHSTFRYPKNNSNKNDDIIEAFYMFNGEKHNIDKSLVARSEPKLTAGIDWTVEYKITGTGDYDSKTELRRGYIRDSDPGIDPGGCVMLTNMTPPSWWNASSASGTDLTIEKHREWKYNDTWTVSGFRDNSAYWDGGKFSVDFSDKNFNYVYPLPGTYTLKFIAMGGCAINTPQVYTRKIIVSE